MTKYRWRNTDLVYLPEYQVKNKMNLFEWLNDTQNFSVMEAECQKIIII